MTNRLVFALPKMSTGSCEPVLTPITFIVADQQNLFIEGMTRIIQEKCPQSQVVGASTMAELIDCLHEHSPQTIFLNFSFIEGDFHLLRPVLAAKDYPEIVAICNTFSGDARKLCASIGAQGIIDKNVNAETIWGFIEEYHDNGKVKEAPMLGTKISARLNQASLTAKQLRILTLLVRGMTNREISSKVGCAENTVKVHLNNAYRILGVKNRTQAMCVMSKIVPLSNIA